MTAGVVQVDKSLDGYRAWLLAASVYNFCWGTLNVLFPSLLFSLLRIPPPTILPLWQVVGMLVLVYAPGYWWASRYPRRHAHLVLIGMVGKVLGPAGFVWAAATGRLPIAFGATILTNDVVWWPAFACYLSDAARLRGGWRLFLSGA